MMQKIARGNYGTQDKNHQTRRMGQAPTARWEACVQ
jgi:hypothetical protein